MNYLLVPGDYKTNTNKKTIRDNRIQFTYGIENNNSFPFKDSLVSRTTDKTNWYQNHTEHHTYRVKNILNSPKNPSTNRIIN